MFGRTTISLAIGLAVLVAPAAPVEIAKAVSPKKSCCSHVQVNADPCHGCPMTPSSPNSSSASTCCSVQAPCFVGYASISDDFLAGLDHFGSARFSDDRVSQRSHRPPVPPPRAALS